MRLYGPYDAYAASASWLWMPSKTYLAESDWPDAAYPTETASASSARPA